MLRIALVTLLLAAGAAAEIPLGPADRGIAPGRRNIRSVATDGNTYFALWTEDHRGLVGARFTHEGELVDTSGIPLATSAWSAAAIWTGEHYLVVWYVASAGELYTRTVTPDGRPGEPVRIRRISPGWGEVSVATNGSTVAIVVGGSMLITSLDGRTVLVSSGASNDPEDAFARVGVAGRNYVVLTGRGLPTRFDLYVNTVDEAAIPSPRRLLANEVASAAVAGNGESALVVWRTPYSAASVIVSPRGELRPAFVPDPAYFLDLTWTGSEYLYRYVKGPAVEFLRVSSGGEALGEPARLVGKLGAAFGFAVRPDGTAMIVWLDDAGRVQAMAQSGWPYVLGRPFMLSATPHGHSGVHLACTSRGVVAAWVEQEGLVQRIRLGHPGGESVVVWGDAPSVQIVGAFVVEETIWLVWQYNRGDAYDADAIAVQRFTLSFAPVSAIVTAASGVDVSDASAAASSAGLAVVWRSLRTDRTIEQTVSTVVIPPYAELARPPHEIAKTSAVPTYPAVAWRGTAAEFTVAWHGLVDRQAALLVHPFYEYGRIGAQPSVLAQPFRPTLGAVLAAWAPGGTAYVWVERLTGRSAVKGVIHHAGRAGAVQTLVQGDAVHALVATSSGFALLREDKGALMLTELAPDLTPLAHKLVARASLTPSAGDVVSCNGTTFAAYTRPVLDPEFGGVKRAFVSVPTPVRMRSVRH